MKSVLQFVLVLLFAASFSVAVADQPQTAAETETHTYEFSFADNSRSDLLWDNADHTTGYYPDCVEMDGFYCPVPGVRARCYWYQYSEPMMCLCGSNNLWTCH